MTVIFSKWIPSSLSPLRPMTVIFSKWIPSSLSPLLPMTVIFSKWIPSSRNESLLPYAIFGCNNMESTIVECQTKQSPLEKRVSSL